MRAVAILIISSFVLLSAAPVAAEPPAPMADRVRVLTVEMNRGPAEALAPLLDEGVHDLSRWYAIRALGRIGDRGKAPEMLAELLDKKAKPLKGILWAAGIAQTESLYEPIKKHLKHEDTGVIAAAAEALGWTGKAEAVADLTPLLNHKDWVVRRGALMGLARLRPEGVLERVVLFLHDSEPQVQQAAGFASWLIAGSRKRAAKAVDPEWDGDIRIARVVMPLLQEDDSDRKMDALRVLGSVLPEDLEDEEGVAEALAPLTSVSDARVVQDLIWRILTPRKGELSDRMLTGLLTHRDAKVRHMAIEGLGQHGSDAAKEALWTHAKGEKDPRLQQVLVVELTRLKKLDAAAELRDRAVETMDTPPVPQTLLQMTHLQSLVLADTPESLRTIGRDFTAAHLRDGKVHSICYMTAFGELEGKEADWIPEWLAGFLPKGGPLDVVDPHVTASAIGLVAANKYWPLYAGLKKSCGTAVRDLLHGEVRLALADAFGKLAGDDKCPAPERAWMEDWLRRAMFGDHSAWVRAKARASLEALGIDGLPEDDVLPPTDWKGLPRPTSAVLGIDFSKGKGDWLSAEEILTLADAIFTMEPRLRFETTQGAFEVELEPDRAPVHCASVVLAVHAGLYDGTRWHRVVPNFVIQGGDPHGHGAGNGGWFVPDEITRVSYRRGVLGMPKSRKDDGGCQLFFMHTHYIPLDERYTAYGNVLTGMQAVDKIRVGDRITKATIVR